MTGEDFMYRSSGDMLITSCPQCHHEFPLPPVPCCQPLVSIQLSPEAACTVTVHPRRVQVGTTGGGIVRESAKMCCVGEKALDSPPEEDFSPPSPLKFLLRLNKRDLSPEADLERLLSTWKALKTSGWYYKGLSWKASADLLSRTPRGTFLVRDSSDHRFLFALSVQTERGPTSVRLHYHDGNFRLDAEQKLIPLMPVFRCVVELVQHYVTTTALDREKRGEGKDQVWIDFSGHPYSNVLLAKPLYQRGKVPTLQHLTRLAINKLKASGESVPTDELPECLHMYLAEYPYIQ